MKSLLLIMLLLAVYLQGAVAEHVLGFSSASRSLSGVVAGLASCGVDLCIIGLVLVTVNWWRGYPMALLIAGLYVVWAAVSAFMCGDPIPNAMLYVRYPVYAALLYTVMLNVPLTGMEMRRIRMIVAALFALQICASLVGMLVFGVRLEWRVGTMTTAGGELATIFPLFCFGIMLGVYFFVRPSFWVALAGLAFAAISFSSEKRAIWWLLPLFGTVDLLVYLALFRRFDATQAWAKCRRLAIGLPLVLIPTALAGMAFSHGTGDGSARSVWQIIDNAWDYSLEYETRHENRLAFGRTTASQVVLEHIQTGPAEKVWFGFGPSSFRPEEDNTGPQGGGFLPLGIIYGIVGWSLDAVAIGVPGVLLQVLLYGSIVADVLRLLRAGGRYHSRWTLASAYGVLTGTIVLTYCYFFYGAILQMSEGMPVLVPLVLMAAFVKWGTAEKAAALARSEATDWRGDDESTYGQPSPVGHAD